MNEEVFVAVSMRLGLLVLLCGCGPSQESGVVALPVTLQDAESHHSSDTKSGDARAVEPQDARIPLDVPEPQDILEPQDFPPPVLDAGLLDTALGLDGDSDVDSPPEAVGNWDVQWMHGSPDCSTSTDPLFQVHAYNENTYVLRQSKCANFEAPFLYLLFGESHVFLQDTGAVSAASSKEFSVRDVVEAIIGEWLEERGRTRDSMELLVTHSHAHSDHTQGDAEFQGQPFTTVVGTSLAEVQAFYGFVAWPTEIVSLDLGNRVLEITGIPGHHPTSIAVYDAAARLLLTGDTVYPGHLFIGNYPEFVASITHLVQMMSTREADWVLGTHVEMTAEPGVAYSYGTLYQPNEHPLQLPIAFLGELQEALSPNPACIVLDSVSVEPSFLGCDGG